MINRKALVLFLVLCILLMPDTIYGQRGQEKQHLLKDVTYTALGIVSMACAYYCGKLTREIFDSYRGLPNYPGWAKFVGEDKILLLGLNQTEHTKRWHSWYSDQYISIGAPVELISAALSTGIFGIMALQFLAKGLHIKK